MEHRGCLTAMKMKSLLQSRHYQGYGTSSQVLDHGICHCLNVFELAEVQFERKVDAMRKMTSQPHNASISNSDQ